MATEDQLGPTLTRREGPAVTILRSAGRTPPKGTIAVGILYGGRLAAVGYPRGLGASHPRGEWLDADTLPLPGADAAIPPEWRHPLDGSLERVCGPMLTRAERAARAEEIADRGAYLFDLVHIAIEEYPGLKLLIVAVGPVLVFEAELILRIR